MTIYRSIQLAARVLSRNRLRSLFMMLGIIVGIASLTALASIGESTRQDTMRRFKRMVGTFDTIIVRPGAGRTRGMPSLTTVPPSLKFEDAHALAAQVPGILRVAEVQTAFDVDVKYRDKTTAPAIFGVTSNWMAMRDDEVTAGSFISDDDVAGLARVAILGADVSATLFPDENPLGKTLRIADVPFVIKGVLASRGAGPAGANLDNVLLIPVTTASRRLFNRDYLTMAIAQLKNPDQGDKAVAEISALLRQRHHIVPPASDDFTITNPRAAVQRVAEVNSTLSRVLSGVAVLATLVGGVVIMSLMLIAVAERRREIGVRRAVGANQRDILQQFLVEALVVSAVGGTAGVAIGVMSTIASQWFQQMPPAIAWNAMVSAIVGSAAVGIVFGLHPAWRASHVEPVSALRS
jgi:putative ABC transport system permease protein